MANLTHLNASTEPLINTQHRDSIRIVHRAKLSEGLRTYIYCLSLCSPCSLFCQQERILQRTYLQIHENRVEGNYPSLVDKRCCCCCACCGKVQDNVDVTYFDAENMEEAGRAGCCEPACTHCSCCPTCCDMCGEAVVIHKKSCACCEYKLYGCLANGEADAFVRAYNVARANSERRVPVRTAIIQEPSYQESTMSGSANTATVSPSAPVVYPPQPQNQPRPPDYYQSASTSAERSYNVQYESGARVDESASLSANQAGPSYSSFRT